MASFNCPEEIITVSVCRKFTSRSVCLSVCLPLSLPLLYLSPEPTDRPTNNQPTTTTITTALDVTLHTSCPSCPEAAEGGDDDVSDCTVQYYTLAENGFETS